MTNEKKLKAKIVESGFNQEQVAEMLGLTIATFNYKVNGKSEFKASEIKKLWEVLSLTESDCMAIFFADAVE